MADAPLAVAVAALIKDGRILLIKRAKGSYAGMWGLPGGKIEGAEHASEAAVREVLEESGIASEVKRFMGVVSEHLIEGGRVLNHFLLFIFELDPKATNVTAGAEGRIEWIGLKGIEDMKKEIIPSDFAVIEGMLGGEGAGYYDCVLEKSGDDYLVRRFERLR
ncbi:ADP-ribose pyrophosphatase [uncultured archaeon]|nr:ADP-ribose pyrophosphatase [uncultured archaeon]